MKEIKLHARLSAYSKVDAVDCNSKLEKSTRCDIDRLFGDPCEECNSVSKPGEVSYAHIDSLFK